MDERAELEVRFQNRMKEALHMRRWVSPTAQKDAPFLRWFKYKEAFSPILVEWALDQFYSGGKVLDPFCGRGTTLQTCARRGVSAYGIDISPLAYLLSQVNARYAPHLQPGTLRSRLDEVLDAAKGCAPASIAEDLPILQRAFSPGTLDALRRLWTAVDVLPADVQPVWQALVLATVERVSLTRKDGAYLRLVRDRQVETPNQALAQLVEMSEEDLRRAQREAWLTCWRDPVIYLSDARQAAKVLPVPVDLIIFSPPFSNRYDYTEIYSLELALGFFQSQSEIKELRQKTIRSHVSFSRPKELSVHPAIQSVYDAWESRGIRLNNPQVRYMLAAYFEDMGAALRNWRSIICPGGTVVMDVANVCFGGEVVPVDLILCDLAEQYGFTTEQVLIARYKGNSSQQMSRFRRQPVRESIVIWRACD